MGKTLFLCGVLALLCCVPHTVTAGTFGDQGQLLAQGPPGGMQGQPGMQRPQGQPGGMQPAAPGGASSCNESYQRCVMMCAGVGDCVNNCNMGYAVCTQQQKSPGGGAGPRPGGS